MNHPSRGRGIINVVAPFDTAAIFLSVFPLVLSRFFFSFSAPLLRQRFRKKIIIIIIAIFFFSCVFFSNSCRYYCFSFFFVFFPSSGKKNNGPRIICIPNASVKDRWKRRVVQSPRTPPPRDNVLIFYPFYTRVRGPVGAARPFPEFGRWIASTRRVKNKTKKLDAPRDYLYFVCDVSSDREFFLSRTLFDIIYYYYVNIFVYTSAVEEGEEEVVVGRVRRVCRVNVFITSKPLLLGLGIR